GAPNDRETFGGVTAPAIASSQGGCFPSPLMITLSCNGAPIVFTMDGSLPGAAATPYSSPIAIDRTTVIRFRGAAAGSIPGMVETNTYIIGDDCRLPVFSLSVDPGTLFDHDTGIYMKGPLAGTAAPYFGANFWLDKEVPVHLEFFEPGGTPGFEADVGLKIFGNYSRQFPKKSLALFFRKQYGQGSLSYRFFPDYPDLRTFESFILRNNGSNMKGALFEDALAGRLVAELGLDFQKYRPAVVYINGAYWGIMNLREKLNSHYLTTNYGYPPEQVDFIKAYGELESGDKNHYEEMLMYMRVYDIALPERYAHVATQMDIDNYINYVTAEVYFANTDWPANNNGWWRPRTAMGKWRWILYDVDGGFGSWGQPYDTNMLAFATATDGPDWPNPPWSTVLLRTLLKNDDFKRRFINRAATLLSIHFETAAVNTHIDRLAAAIQGEIPRECVRWEKTESQWASSVNRLKEWARYRPDGMRKTYVAFFSLGGTALLDLAVSGNGTIGIDGITPGSFPFRGTYFKGNPVKLTAVPGNGAFKQWSDGVTGLERMVDLTGDLSLEAVFE
ncbi:MAG: CotH kinase family protein, partial [Chitinispirillaceae bacterium]|nr:CotH kinase family protein [Chitinispirillaceae bacterium]